MCLNFNPIGFSHFAILKVEYNIVCSTIHYWRKDGNHFKTHERSRIKRLFDWESQFPVYSLEECETFSKSIYVYWELSLHQRSFQNLSLIFFQINEKEMIELI